MSHQTLKKEKKKKKKKKKKCIHTGQAHVGQRSTTNYSKSLQVHTYTQAPTHTRACTGYIGYTT